MSATQTSSHGSDSAFESAESLQFELARELIADRYGFWVGNSWSGQLETRLAARAEATGRIGIGDYLNLLRSPEGENEIVTLVEGLLNGETCFLRTQPHFAALLETVMRPWRASHAPGQRFRIASLGCSTGEEPYSIAMVLNERLSASELADIEISGLDVNSRALAMARTANYEEFQLRELTDIQRQRWFTKVQGQWQLHPTLRAGVRFLQHNLLEPLPFAGLDVIFCRNVMIYFKQPLVSACFAEFHSALRPGGFLFLGHSESAFGFPEYFEPVQIPDGVIYQKKPATIFPS